MGRFRPLHYTVFSFIIRPLFERLVNVPTCALTLRAVLLRLTNIQPAFAIAWTCSRDMILQCACETEKVISQTLRVDEMSLRGVDPWGGQASNRRKGGVPSITLCS